MQLPNRLKAWTYNLIVLFIAMTGFAQMPIFKRYYVSDVPGLGWLAEFYITHRLHYILAAMFIAIVFYKVVESLITKSWAEQYSKIRVLKTIAVSGLIITGGLMVYKNFGAVYLPHNLIIALNIGHLGFCMLFLFILPYAKNNLKSRTG